MPERVHVRFGDGENHQHVSDQGKKRKRAGGEHAAKPNGLSADQQHVASQKMHHNGYAQKSHAVKDGSLPLSNGDAHGKSLIDHKSKPNSRPAPKTNGIDAARQRYTSLAQKRDELLKTRKKLPIWPHAERIRQSLRGEKDVMLLVGETGSGKSTQVPQFLLTEKWCTGCIAVTQPRRVAAISLAKRVAEEMGTPLGSSSPASKVGYSVRFDHSVSPNTKIKFVTEGMLLQELLRDPSLKQYSAVIVDEVHERSVNVDLILGFLRNLVRGDKSSRKGQALKVAVMSATADVQKLNDFFEGNNSANLTPTSPVEEVETKSEASWGGLSENENETEAVSNGTSASRKIGTSTEQRESTSICFIEGRQFPVQITYLSDPTLDFVEAALKAVLEIHRKEPLPGDILVFVTGQDTVEGLERLINDFTQDMDPSLPKVLTLPLFAALPQAAQQRVFLPAPHRTRKIVISTNIAETSVTVPGVRFVVDSGKHKIKQYRNKLGLDSLLVKAISKSSAIQRTGRAGREAPGKCMRLFTEKDFQAMEKTTKPEILRCDLAQAVVTMKARGVDDVIGFPWLDAPPHEALGKALIQLYELGALNDSGKITDIGQTIAKLPLTPSLGRVLVEAAKPERDCLLEIIEVVAALSVENIFLNVMSEEKKEEAEAARAELYRRESDHLTMLAVVRSYAAENTDRKKWTSKYFISHRAMQNIMDIRKQLTQLCKQLGLVDKDERMDETPDYAQTEALNTNILQCILQGFATNTARLTPDGSYRTVSGNQTVAIHPSSVLFGKKVEAIAFTEYVFTNKAYARGCSIVRLAWIDEAVQALA